MSIKSNASYRFNSFGKADITNWNWKPEVVNSDLNLGTGGFYAFGVDGVFKGVVIILFMFIAFDTMVLSRWAESVCFSMQYTGDTQPVTIEHFTKTINQAILSINTVILLCLLGMAFALTTIQPIYPSVSFSTLNSFQLSLYLSFFLIIMSVFFREYLAFQHQLTFQNVFAWSVFFRIKACRCCLLSMQCSVVRMG